MTGVRIAGMASALPPTAYTSHEIEQLVRQQSPQLRFIPGTLKTLTGVKSRRYVADGVNTSDLAAAACRKVLDKTETALEDVDLLIFSAASQDMLEPATAHVIQDKLGSGAAVMDIKNACNSFLNGIQVAEALIQSGQYRKALVCSGEIPSRSIKWQVDDFDDLRNSFMGYTLGDAGAAALLEPTQDGCGIFYRRFVSASKHWSLVSIAGGGSRHPRGDEYTYCQGDGVALRDAFDELGPRCLQQAMAETGLCFSDFSRILVHQVTLSFLKELLRVACVPSEKVVLTLPEYGNMVSASLPVAFDLAESRGEIKRGDKVLCIGLAAGISLGILMFQY